jgi:hypothetical protein
MGVNMGRSERKFNEELILEYKDTGCEDLFQTIITGKDIKKYVTYVCDQKLRHSPTTLYSMDDLTNIGYLVIWQSIHKYKFICPECGLHAKSNGAYKLHTLAKHGQYIEPKVSISRFLKFNLGAYLQNTIKREYSLDRKSNVLTVNIFSPDDDTEEIYGSTPKGAELEIVSDVCLESAIVFKDVIEKVKGLLDPFAQEVFTYLYSDDMKQREIASFLHGQGRYSSEQSAAVIVSRVVKTKINPIIATLYPELTKY